MTAKRARKSPKVETICAYQRRRMVTTRRTAPMLRGSGALGAGMGTASTVLASDWGSTGASSWLRDSWLMALVPSRMHRRTQRTQRYVHAIVAVELREADLSAIRR